MADKTTSDKQNKKRKEKPIEEKKKRKRRKRRRKAQFCNECGRKANQDAEACGTCERVFCEECLGADEGCWVMNEWLITSSKWCAVCGAVVCRACLWTCYSCASDDAHSRTFCLQCKPKDWSEKCELHTWQRCGKHKDEPCGTCRANANYDRYGF